MSVRLRWAAPLAGAAALLLAALPARAAAPEWVAVPLPGGRHNLLSQLGMSPDVPPALLVGEVIRVVHASQEIDTPVRAALRQHFAAPQAAAPETVPLPLTLEKWRDLLGRGVSAGTLLASILDDRRASLLCYGLLQLDAGTLEAVAADAGLLRRIYERHSGRFAAFAHVISIRDDRLQLPGGDAVQPVWEELVGEPLAPASRAVASLVSADEGRLLYFAEAVASLDAGGVGLVFSSPLEDVTPADQARSVYRSFTDTESGWAFGEFPFVRLGADPALSLRLLQADPATGRLRRTREFWDAVFDDGRLPRDHTKKWAHLDEGDRAEPGWLLRRMLDAPLPVRARRLLVFQFTERLGNRLPRASVADLAWLARAYRRYPSLLLTLERLSIDDADVFQRLVSHAGRLTAVAGDLAQLETHLTLFQAPLMYVVRARQANAIDGPRAAVLVDALSRIEPSKRGYGRALARWFENAFLPAVGHDKTLEGASAEASVLEALAGMRAQAAAIPPLTWESHTYRVDLAAPELARLTEVRARQGGNTLDTALALCRVGATIDRGGSLQVAPDAATQLSSLEPAIVPIEQSERPTASAPPDLAATLGQAGRDLARVRARSDLRRLTSIAERLSVAEDAALADVLTSILYAVWLGDPEGQAFLAGNVARRHDFGLRLMTGADREQTPWEMPIETSGDGQPWHLRGALLGLDVGLARLGLRRTRLDLPDKQPTLNESDRRTLLTTLALTRSAALDQGEASQLMQWMREGRATAADPQRLSPQLERLALDGRRRQAVSWAMAHAPETLPQLFMRTELVLLGAGGRPAPDVWGAADTARSGCLCLRFPAPPALQHYVGRAGAGLLASRMSEVKLRVLEALDERALPASLAGGVLASALQDYLEDVRPLHGDDWLTLARHLDRVPADRFDDYVAALTAGGPLVPLAEGPAETASHRP